MHHRLRGSDARGRQLRVGRLCLILSIIGTLFALAILVALPAAVIKRDIDQLAEAERAPEEERPANPLIARFGAEPASPQDHKQQPEVRSAHCGDYQNHKDDDLCAQREAIQVVSRGNKIQIVALRTGAVGMLISVVTGLVSGLSLVLAIFAVRDASSALRLLQSQVRGFLSISFGRLDGNEGVRLTNVGQMPLWILDVFIAGVRVPSRNGIRCLAAGKSEMIGLDAGRHGPALKLAVVYRDALNVIRHIEAMVGLRAGRWTLDEFEDRQGD